MLIKAALLHFSTTHLEVYIPECHLRHPHKSDNMLGEEFHR